MARPSIQEARRPWLMMNSPREWPQPPTSFWETMRLSTLMGQHPSPAFAPSRPTAWEAWVQRQNHAPSSISATSRTQRVRARMNYEITHRHTVMSLVIRWLSSATPRKAKFGAKTKSCMANEPPIMIQRTVSLHLETCAFEEAGSLSAPCPTSSGLNHTALRTRFHGDRSHQLFINSSNRI